MNITTIPMALIHNMRPNPVTEQKRFDSVGTSLKEPRTWGEVTIAYSREGDHKEVNVIEKPANTSREYTYQLRSYRCIVITL